LIQIKDGLPEIKNETKYRFVGNLIRNNFLIWDFLKFGLDFKLKFKEALGV
jgi:hypothetical protein